MEAPPTSSATTTPPTAPRVPDAAAKLRRYVIIGGSGVTLTSDTTFSWPTPYGSVTGLSFLDAGQRVLFVNRHFCTNIGADGEPTYAPPHDVNFKAMLWAFKDLGCVGICALGSTGTLRPETVPVGSVVMPDDFFCTLPNALTYWPHKASPPPPTPQRRAPTPKRLICAGGAVRGRGGRGRPDPFRPGHPRGQDMGRLALLGPDHPQHRPGIRRRHGWGRG